MIRTFILSLHQFFSILLVVLFFLSPFFGIAHAAQVPPQILTYQGRLANSAGDLLGSSSGTTYYFKFSIWDNATINTGTQL